MDDFYIPGFDVLVSNMPQYQEHTSLLPAGVYLDSMDDDADIPRKVARVDCTSMNVRPFSQESDTDISNSQKSDSSSHCFDILKLGMRINSKGSIVDSEEDFTDLSDQSVAGVESILRTVSARHAQLDQGALYRPDSNNVSYPRSATPSKRLSRPFDDKDRNGIEASLVTPTKPTSDEDPDDPLTPMANLKMLMNAASPEIRNRERELMLEQQQQVLMEEKTVPMKRKSTKKEVENVIKTEMEVDAGPQGSRKDKSLGLLCHRFLAKFPEYPSEYESNIQISLDEVAKELCVERRRIYDIVNVLESVEMVSRLAKNKYAWHGKSKLPYTLAKLKALGKSENMDREIQRIQSGNVSSDNSPRKRTPLSFCDENTIKAYSLLKGGINATQTVRKDKSLGIMSQKFLMLFLVTENDTINLDCAAKILIGDSSNDNANFKTKIRRLYDIANILTSLLLIQKVHVAELRGRKPAFQYIGPDIPEIKHEASGTLANTQNQSSKHSLLDGVHYTADFTSAVTHGRKIEQHNSETPRYNIFDKANSAPSAPTKKVFSRHASLEQICKVAEQERNRLYFESRSQPTSPTNIDTPITKTGKSTLHPVSSQNSQDSVRHIVVIRGSKDVEGGKMKSTVHKIPVSSTKTVKITDNTDNPKSDKLDKHNDESSTITLTKEQLDTLMKTIAEKKDEQIKRVDAATQSSPALTNRLSAAVKSEIQAKAGSAKVIQVSDFKDERTNTTVTSSMAGVKRSLTDTSEDFSLKRRRIVSVSAINRKLVSEENNAQSSQIVNNRVTKKPMTVRKLYVNAQGEDNTIQAAEKSYINTPTNGLVISKAQRKLIPDNYNEKETTVHRRSLPTSPSFQFASTSPNIMVFPERPASAELIRSAESMLPPQSLKSHSRMLQRNLSFQPPVVSNIGALMPPASQVLSGRHHITQITPVTNISQLTPQPGIIQLSGYPQYSPVTTISQLTPTVNGVSQITPTTAQMAQLTPVSGSHVMVTPDGCRMVSGIMPSSSTIINLQPFFNSPNHSAVDVKPENVPFVSLSTENVTSSQQSGDHTTGYRQMMQPVIIAHSKKPCTASGQIIGTSLLTKRNHYSTPGTGLSLSTGTITANVSAFKPVTNTDNCLSGNSMLPVAARKLSLPNV